MKFAEYLSKSRLWFSDRPNQVFVLIGLFLVCAALTAPLQRKGDASEYVLATESLRYDQDLRYSDNHDLRWHAQRRPEGLFDTPTGLTLMPGTDGAERFGLHSFYYPVLAAPFFAAFGYRGFYLLNALAVLVILGAVYSYFSRTHERWHALSFASAAVFLSAAWSYVFFMQTETVYAALISAFLCLWLRGKPRSAAAFAGIMSGAQMPLALLVLPFGVDLLRRRDFKNAAVCALIVAAGLAPQVAYNLIRLGELFPMQARGLADFRFISISVLLRTLFDPSMGVFWFYPIGVYCLLNARYDAKRVLLLVSSFLIVVLMNTVGNIYSHEVGTRFGIYLFPVFLFSVERLDVSSWRSRAAIVFTVLSGAGLALNPIGNSYDMDIRKKTFLPYQAFSKLPFYRDNPEVFRTSSVPIEEWVRGRNVFPDRWTQGGERATLLFEGIRPGVLEIDVTTWGLANKKQRVILRTHSGAQQELWLPPRTTETLRIPITEDDVFRYERMNQDLTYLFIEAHSWTPAWNVEGGNDRRRLGIRLLAFRGIR